MKTCTKCQETKTLESFHVNNKSKDGRQYQCKMCIAIHKREYDARPDIKARKANYTQANLHIWWELKYKQRTKQYGLPAIIVRFTLEDLIARDGDTCVDCGADWESLDHVVPVIAGGTHTLDNCELVCNSCNQKRWNEYSAKLKADQPEKLV